MRFIGFILGLLLSGVAAAQSSASHPVAITIPTVLRFGLADGASGQRQTVPLQVEVTADQYRIIPSTTTLIIFANSSWQLSVSYTGDELALTWQLGDKSGQLHRYPQVLASGGSTGGWRTIMVRYGLSERQAARHYQGLVTYTLTRP